MLSRATKYAFRAVSYLTKNPERKIVIKEMSEELDIPNAFLAKILQKLVKNDIVSSSKGPNGGFYLSELNRKKRIISIVEVIDGLHKFDECFLEHTGCDESNPCIIHQAYSYFKLIVLEDLSTKTIEEIVPLEEINLLEKKNSVSS